MQHSAFRSAEDLNYERKSHQQSRSFVRLIGGCGPPVQTHHLQGSPMLLCDSCPRGFHMACLELDYEQLPIGDWACPKCELGEAKAAKREARAANKDR